MRYLLTYLLILTGLTGFAQQRTGLVVAVPGEENSSVRVKWLTPELISRAGHNVYRRPTGGGDWTKLNATPLTVGAEPLDPALVAADSSLRIARDLALRQDFDRLPPLAKVNFLTAAVTVPEFARFLGIEYADRTVVPGTRYEYEVRVRQGGGESAVGRTAAVALDDDPGYPNAPPLTGEYDPETKTVTFDWPHRPADVFAYHIERLTPDTRLNPRPIIVLNNNASEGPRFSDEDPGSSRSNRYRLLAIDYFGRVSPKSTEVTVELPDLSPPAPPTDPASDNSVDGVVTLSWAASPDDDVVAYRVARTSDAAVPAITVGRVAVPTTTFRDDQFPGYGYYYYEIYAIDAAGNESALPLYHIANATDLKPPSPPSGVSIDARSGAIELNWSPNQEGDLAGYLVFRSMDVKGTGTWAALHVEPFAGTTFTDDLPPTRRNIMIYHVIAMDTTGNRSEPSAIVRAAMLDEVPPPVPFLRSVRTSGDSVFLTWEPVTEGDLRGYRLERSMDGTYQEISRPDGAREAYVDAGVPPGARLQYRLRSVDTTGNVSAPSEPLSATVPLVGNATGEFTLEGKYRRRDEGVQLRWAGPVGKSYVFRRRGSSGRFQPLDVTVAGNDYFDKPGANGRYDYFIKTYADGGGGTTSRVLTVVVK